MTRYNTTKGAYEYYDADAWETPLLSATGTGLDTAGRVFFADANGRAAGISELTYNSTTGLTLNRQIPTGGTALTFTATMPTTMSATQNGLNFQFTTAGSSNPTQRGLNFEMLPGYTGTGLVNSFRIVCSAASAGTNVAFGGGGNIANTVIANGSTTGHNAGTSCQASGGSVNFGLVSRALVAAANATNIGVFSVARNTNATNPIQIGGYFGFNTSNPTFQSAALIADNSNATDPIFLARDNGTASFRIDDGGRVTINSATAGANTLQVNGSLGRKAPVTVTATPYDLLEDDTWVIVNRAATTTINLPAASSWTGRELTIKTVQAQTVVSASSNVIAIGDASPTTTTSILPATDGAWALLVSDGTNWVIMQRG
jgi:hypothetical protein